MHNQESRGAAGPEPDRAGVAQHVVMQLYGWKPDAMFRRCAIAERDLRDAVLKSASMPGTSRPLAHEFKDARSRSRPI